MQCTIQAYILICLEILYKKLYKLKNQLILQFIIIVLYLQSYSTGTHEEIKFGEHITTMHSILVQPKIIKIILHVRLKYVLDLKFFYLSSIEVKGNAAAGILIILFLRSVMV